MRIGQAVDESVQRVSALDIIIETCIIVNIMMFKLMRYTHEQHR